ncbi:MAG: hypothetical protein IJJ06_09320 [Mogibacterium sp.]|nr:hypothetical protein [Mogibacterium sp.]
MSPQKAVDIGSIESETGIKSTFFVLLSSRYYNLVSGENREAVKELIRQGHEIGLHFDVTNYDEDYSLDELCDAIKRERLLLESLFDIQVRSMSWHIPKRELIGVNIPALDEIGLLNAYDPEFYNGYKYVSDSMMRWREPIDEYLEKAAYEKMQILTHPIWYSFKQNKKDLEILKAHHFGEIKKDCIYLDAIRPGYKDILELSE